MCKRSGGFTLVEVLVVLTMISMLSALLFQGFGYMLATYDRLQARQSAEFQKSLAAGWWRESLEAAVPYYDNPLRFSGDEQSMAGASYASLWGPPGVPAEMRWSLERSGQELLLVYEQPPELPVTVRRWDRRADASFAYLSEQGEWQADWRPERDRQLPEAVRLTVDHPGGGDSGATRLTATIPIRKSQFVPTTDILYGRE